MRFFKSKKKDVATEAVQKDLQGDKVAETRRDLKSELDTAVVPSLKAQEEKPAETRADAAAEAPAETKAVEKPLTQNAGTTAETTMVRLFPGFENQPFEIGYAGFKSADYGIGEEAPMLLMRWKAGSAKWFPLPPMFNKAVLEQIHEEDNDLDRLLIGYGYDAEQLVHKL
ncbi:hypothetical protein [Aquisalinus flavus]|uniref:Uncharacterized protein n=1 Tax=Aquisalinus flavus TaxID=1526572 RepID=A0A8J2V5V4_9PROT|nr:hypothetical protein [Aquisalinus flavus]MBD0425388.1 hypothetical protein [Aquisalinus flavus]UNE48965.1 hypothetical protein FF099_13370 [Aquisalinus flavus]GGD16472.1 hypothetical protein GCM10011342_26550 [Aquisalinus flavus]